MHAAHGCSDQPVAFFSVHVVVSARQLTAAQAGPKSQHALSQVKREKPAPSAAMSPGTQSDCGYVTQFGSVDGDTDGEALRDSVREPDIDDDDERVWLADPVVERVKDGVTVADAGNEELSVADLDTDGDKDGERAFDAKTEVLRVTDGAIDTLRDSVALLDFETTAVRLVLAEELNERDGDTDGTGTHWQQALVVTRQLSSLSAPLAKEPGESTSTQAPAPVGSAGPAAGVPHKLPLLARKYAVERPDAHDQFAVRRLAVGAAADKPSQ